MTRFNVNTSYFQHSTPEYNRKHQEENSEYNHEYYEKHKEKWQDNDEDSSKSGSSEDDEKDSKDKKSGSDSKKSKEDKIKSILGKLNGGSKKGGSATGKSSSKKSGSSTKKSKETDEEKKKREEEEKAEKERQLEEERKKNSEAAEKYGKMLEENAKYIEEQQNKKKAKSKTIKHTAVYVGVNSQPYFEHHGRLGMKWGKRNGPPYPLDYSKLSEEERAKDKQRVKDEGDIESVGYKKNRSYFTDQEINEVINRYQLNQRINQLSADSAKMKAGKSKTQELADNMAKVADVGNKLSNALNAGTNVYNNVAKIMNAFGDSDMPIIGQAKQDKPKEFKFTDKDYDSVVKDLGKYTTKELQSINQRKAAIDQISKTQREAKEKKDNETLEAARKLVDEYNNRLVREAEEAAKFESGKYRIRRK